jgi:hypothetical protein
VRASGHDRGSDRLSKIRPALAAVIDVVEVQARLVKEAGEIDVWPISAERSQLLNLRRPSGRDSIAEASEHDVGRLLIKFHVAASREERKPGLDGPFNISP